MGYYCQTAKMRSHDAQLGETLEVRALRTGGTAIFGNKREIACIPHGGCGLEITEVPPVQQLHDGRVVKLKAGQVVLFSQRSGRDYITLPSGVEVDLTALCGFKLKLSQAPAERRAPTTGVTTGSRMMTVPA